MKCIKPKGHIKSHSLLDDDSRIDIKSTKDINCTHIEDNLKSIHFSTQSQEFKSLRTENAILQQRISALRKQHDLEIIKLKKNFEAEKQAEIDSVTKFYIEKITDCEENFTQQLKKRLEIETEKIKQDFEEKYDMKIRRVLQEKQQEYDFLQEQFMLRLKSKENIQFESKSFRMPSYLEKTEDPEYKLKVILEEKCNEYERKISVFMQELQNLRKENNSLKQKLLEVQSRLDIANKFGSDKEIDTTYIVMLNKRYSELLESYNELKGMHERSSKSASAGSYCCKCKAFVDTNSDLSKKIVRLREFLSG